VAKVERKKNKFLKEKTKKKRIFKIIENQIFNKLSFFLVIKKFILKIIISKKKKKNYNFNINIFRSINK
jgi:hypothetical protein